jgi:heat shock protein HslJ
MKILVLTAAALALAAPASAQQKAWAGEPMTPIPIDGAWEVVSVAGYPMAPGIDVTMTFQGGQVSGTTGCSNFRGAVATDGVRLAFSDPLLLEEGSCKDRRGTAQEARLVKLLGEQLTINKGRGGYIAFAARSGDMLVLKPAS